MTKATAIKNVEKRIHNKFMAKALELQNNATADPETKRLEWAMLTNTIAAYARSKVRRLTEDELRGITTHFVTLVAGDKAEETMANGLVDDALAFGMALQDEVFKTRCWGLCKS